jgi:hypothetical protein
LNKGEYIEKCIKEQRISWLGQLERMEEDSMPKKDLHSRTGKEGDEEEDPGKEGEKNEKESFKCWE